MTYVDTVHEIAARLIRENMRPVPPERVHAHVSDYGGDEVTADLVMGLIETAAVGGWWPGEVDA